MRNGFANHKEKAIDRKSPHEDGCHFDHDGPSIFQQQVKFIQKSGIVTATVDVFQAPAERDNIIEAAIIRA